MVVLSTGLRFWQEFRSSIAAAALANLVHCNTTVLRQGVQQTIDLKNVVPGDVVKLSAGDLIPGDIRILESRDLFIA